MICNNCWKNIDDGALFCSYCGTKIEQIKVCANCGNNIDSNAQYCSHCGSPTTKLNVSKLYEQKLEESKPEESKPNEPKLDEQHKVTVQENKDYDKWLHISTLGFTVLSFIMILIEFYYRFFY